MTEEEKREALIRDMAEVTLTVGKELYDLILERYPTASPQVRKFIYTAIELYYEGKENDR